MTANATTDEAEQPFNGIRYLDPKKVFIHLGNYNTLHVTITQDRIYPGVWARLIFPVSAPDRYISLQYPTADDEKDHELGVIRDLNEFPEAARRLVLNSLAKQYFIRMIKNIHSIKFKYDLLEFDVTTDQGRKSFLMRWQVGRSQDYGENGKMLIDAFDNWYLIPDVEKLSASERSIFTRFIYW